MHPTAPPSRDKLPRRRAVVMVAVGAALAAGFAWPVAATAVTTTSYPVSAMISVGGFPFAVAVDSSTHTAYVTSEGSNSLSVIDEASNTVTATIGVGRYPDGVAVDQQTHTVYVTNAADNSVSVIDPTSNAVTATISVGSYPFGVAVDPGTHKVYVANAFSNSVSVIDEINNAVTATIGVGNMPIGVAVDPGTRTVYVANSNDSSVSVIDATTNTITGSVGVGSYPAGLAVDPGTNKVYVADAGDGSVSVVDEVSNTVTATIGVGSYPEGVAVDPGTHTVYVGNDGGSVSVIDGTSNTVAATIGVGQYPDYAAVDLDTHAVYVANEGDNSVSVITPKQSQAITFISGLPSAPVSGGTYEVTATGGGSGNAVTFSTTSSACTISGSTVSFAHAGSCVVNADQAGSSGYTAAPQAQQSIVVGLIAQAVTITSTAPAAPVVGMTYPVTATGGASGEPVTLSIASATTNAACTINGSTVSFVHPGSCVVDADQAGNGDYTAAATVSDTMAVSPTASSTTLAVTGTRLTAHVTVTAPGAAMPTGSVRFAVAGKTVGTAPVTNGVATLTYTVSSGATHHLAAVYSGNPDVTGSSVSTSRRDPSITATVHSTHAKTKHGWYRTPVTVTFRCATHGAPLTKTCPAAVIVRTNGAGFSVTRTIAANDGGMATIAVRGINLDQGAPSVSVGRVRNGAVYNATVPTAKCVGKDGLSGILRCTIRKKTSGSKTTITVTATDKAGNTRSAHASYTTLPIYLQGATLNHGAFSVKTGHTYTIVVVGSTHRPTYYDAAVYPKKPAIKDYSFHAAGHHRWTLGVTMTRNLHLHRYWNIGVKIGSTMHLLRIRIS